MVAAAAFAIPCLILAVIVKLSSKGPVLFWSDRVGRNNVVFKMPKFRSMRTDAPNVATHLLTDQSHYITPLGSLMRRTSLDELPQLWSIIVGDMSIVGPRPALFNQDDLIALRTEKNIHLLAPGLTGWAQVNGRDEISIPDKVDLDDYYAKNMSLKLDIQIIIATAAAVLKRKGVSH
jgi:O-antigen biosynthesis protein WbqP